MADEIIKTAENPQESAPVAESKASEGPSTEEIVELDNRLQKLHDRKSELETELVKVRAEIESLLRSSPYEKGEEWVAQGNARLATLGERELEALKTYKKLLADVAKVKNLAEGEARTARVRNGEIVL